MKKIVVVLLTAIFAACSENPEVLTSYVSFQDEQGQDLINELSDGDIVVDSVIWNDQRVTSGGAYYISLVQHADASLEGKRAISFSITTYIPWGDYLSFEDSKFNHVTFYLKIKGAVFSDKPIALSFNYKTSGRHDNQLVNVTFKEKECDFKSTSKGGISIITYTDD